MRNAIFVLLLLIFIISSSAGNGGNENTLSQIKELESKFLRIKEAPADIPAEEINKASKWVEDAKKSLGQEGKDPSLILKKVSYQIELLNALIEESRTKKRVNEMKELLQSIRSQTEQIKVINEEVVQEINRLEQK
jgi:hypothetical protein